MVNTGRRTRRRLIAALMTAGIAMAVTQAAGPRHVSAAAVDPYVSLTGTAQLSSDVLGGLSLMTDNGAYDPNGTLQIGVTISRPDPAGETAFIADVYNPASPNYRHFLDPAGFQARFGVSPARYQAVTTWLQGGGLSVTPVAGNTEYLLAQGPASAVEALLQVHVNNYNFSATGFYANAEAPTVPANLGILGIAGLQSYMHMFTGQQLHAKAAALPGGGPSTPQPVGPGTNVGSTTPQDLWSIYQQPANNRGAGESMAIFGWGCTEPTQGSGECAGIDVTGNLRAFETQYGLPMMPIQITNFGSGAFDNNGTGEWTLDLPASTGMAPDATLEHLYFGVNGQDPDILAAFNGWNGDASGPHQGSASFAGCEATPLTGNQPGGPGNPPGTVIIGNPNQDAYEQTFKETVMLGRTLFNSAGDLGPNGCPVASVVLNGVTPATVYINDYPSVSQYVTTVGGTVLYWNGDGATGPTPATRALETSWTHTGGGTSFYVAAPPWQQSPAFHTNTTSVPGVTQPCAVDWHQAPNTQTYPPGTLCRGIPDVAAQSGDVVSNGYVAGGGTSLSSPLWLGMWTRVQAAAPTAAGLGFASPLFYTNNADPVKYANDFFDIGGASANTAPTCNAGLPVNSCSKPGWDYLSGWGTPNVTNLMLDVDNGNTVPTHVSLPSNVPEAPATALLVLGAVGVVGAVAYHRRRRNDSDVVSE